MKLGLTLFNEALTRGASLEAADVEWYWSRQARTAGISHVGVGRLALGAQARRLRPGRLAPLVHFLGNR